MVLFVTWSHPGASNAPIHAHDLPILGVKVQQREGEVASAQLVVPREAPIDPEYWMTLWYRSQNSPQEAQSKKVIPLFYGRCVGIPSVLDEYSKKIEYLAIPIDAQVQHNSLVQQLREEGHVDERFICPDQQHNPAEYLEAAPQLFCYHRVSHKIILSNLFEGRDTLHLKDQILSGGLVLKLTDSPLSAVKLVISQEWVHEAQGEINLMPAIEARFPHGIINTLTPQSLLSTWPQTGQLLGRSGYAVIKSSLRVSNPNALGGNGIYPTVTPLIQGNRFTRSWLEGELVLTWQYRQKRREVLTLDVHQVTQLPTMQVKSPRCIRLKLREREVLSKGTYFDTPEGKSAIDHAVKIAQCHLAYSSRAAELTIEMSFEEGSQIHLDQSAEVIHECLPGGKVRGKVVSYVLEWGGNKALATVKIAVSVGVGPLEGKENFVVDLKIEKGEEMAFSEQMKVADFMEYLVVENTADEQIKSLQEAENAACLSFEGVTRVIVGLKDLRSHDVLDRAIQGPLLPWSAPRQM